MDLFQQKQSLREHFLVARAALSAERRELAAAAIFETLSAACSASGYVLSYASFGSELDTSEINEWLAEQGKLVLPRVDQASLVLHHVLSCKTDLKLSKWGIMEPKLDCPMILPEQLSLIIIPGIAFDKQKHRLGYGKGYYDCLLANLAVKTIGIGFREQLHTSMLPVFPEDIPLAKVILV